MKKKVIKQILFIILSITFSLTGILVFKFDTKSMIIYLMMIVFALGIGCFLPLLDDNNTPSDNREEV